MRRFGHHRLQCLRRRARALRERVALRLPAARRPWGCSPSMARGMAACCSRLPPSAVLRGEQTVQLRKDPTPRRERTKRAARLRHAALRHRHGRSARPGKPCARCAFRWRRQAGVPPYVIFHDSTLREMLEHRPQSLAALAKLSGVGEVKLGRYGEAFLEVLAQTRTHGLTQTYTDNYR